MRLLVRILLGLAALLALLVIGAALVVATIDRRSLVAPLVTRVESATGRALTIGGEPRIDLSLTPTLVLQDVTLANASWGSAPDMLRAKRVEVEVALLPLLSRRLDIRRFTLVEPAILLETDRGGLANWTLAVPGAVGAGPSSTRRAEAFALGEFGIERGAVTYRDAATGAITPVRVERLHFRGHDPNRSLVGEFRGAVAGVPVRLEGTFGPLAQLRNGPWPWPVSVKGEVAGRKAELAALVEVKREGLEARDLVLALGATRITGKLQRELRAGRARYTFDLEAETLQPTDFAPAVAAAAAPPPAQPREQRVFPATPVAFEGLRRFDAQGAFAIRSLVLDDGRRVGPLSAKLRLDAGKLVLDDVALAAYGGNARGRLAIDAHSATPVLALRLDARQLELAQLVAAAGVKRSIPGVKTDVLVDLTLRGDSPRAWAASASGTAMAKVGSGTIPAQDEDLTAGLRQLFDALNPLRRARGSTDLKCAVVRLPLRDGLARVDRSIAFETGELGASARGTVDLRSETLDLAFTPRVRPGLSLDIAARLARAVHVRGPLNAPAASVDPLGMATAAADVASLLRGHKAGTGTSGPVVGGNECAEALAERPAHEAPSPAPPPAPGLAREAERALRKLFGR